MAETIHLISLRLANGENIDVRASTPADAIDQYLTDNPGSGPVVGWIDYRDKESVILLEPVHKGDELWNMLKRLQSRVK